MAQWYWMKGEQKVGPVDTPTLRRLASTGELKPSDRIWREGLPNWVPASQAKGLFDSDGDMLRISSENSPPPLNDRAVQAEPWQVPSTMGGIARPRNEKQCSKCKEWIDKGATICPHCRSKQPPPAWATIAAIVLLLCLGVWGVRSCSPPFPSSEKNPSSSENSSSLETKGTKTVHTGDDARLRTPGDGIVFVFATENDYERGMQLIAAKDTVGIQQMMLNGRARNVPAGTRCRVIDRGFFKSEVRIMEGAQTGTSGWVISDFLVSAE